MTALVASLVALAAGPLLLLASRRFRASLRALDGFVFVAIGGLVLGHVLRESVGVAGWAALAAVALGYFGPGLVERSLRRAAHQAHTAALLLAMVAVGLHAFGDGLALADPGGPAGHGHSLPLAVILHRLPVGLTLWWLLRPVYGRRWAAAVLVAVGVATIGGYSSVGGLTEWTSSQAMALLRSLVAGSLLHVVVHRSTGPVEGTRESPRGWNLSEGLGGIAAAVLGWFVLGEEGATAALRWPDFETMTLAWSPAVLLAFALAAAFSVLPVPPAPGNPGAPPLAQALDGVADGMRRGLLGVRRVVAPTAGTPRRLAAGLAGRAFEAEAIVLSFPLLGWPLAVARLVAAAVVALVPAWRLGRLLPATGAPAARDVPAPPVVRLLDRIDHVLPALLLGLVVAALLRPWAGEALIVGRVPVILQIVGLAAVALPASLDPAGAVPVAAALIHAGVSPGAAIAFLVAGSATDLGRLSSLGRVAGRSAAFVMATEVLVLSIISGQIVAVTALAAAPPPPTRVGEGAWLLAAGALGVLVLVSFLRQGPRRFVGRAVPLSGPDTA